MAKKQPSLNPSSVSRRLHSAGISRLEVFYGHDRPPTTYVHYPSTSTTLPPGIVDRLDRAETVLREAGFTVSRNSPASLSLTLPEV